MAETKKEKKECPECDGSGWGSCHSCGSDIDCERCDGTGKIEEDED